MIDERLNDKSIENVVSEGRGLIFLNSLGKLCVKLHDNSFLIFSSVSSSIKEYISKNFNTISKFNNITDWSVTANSPEISNISQDSDLSSLGGASFKFTTETSSGVNAMINQNKSFNLSSSKGFWVFWENKYLVTGTTQGFTLYLSHLPNFTGGEGRVSSSNRLNSQVFGKTCEWISNSNWTTVDGTPDFEKDWKSWRLLISSATQDRRDFNIEGVYSKPSSRKATIIITLDDGLESGFTIGHAESFKRSIPLTHYIIASLVDVPGRTSTSQLNLMKSRGDYIGVHGQSEWASDISILETDLENLKVQGIADLSHGAWPDGVIGSGYSPREVISQAKELGLKTIRKTSSGGNGVFIPAFQELGCLPAKPLNNTLSLEQAKTFVDMAVESNGTLIFYGHGFGPTSNSTTWTSSDWIDLLDYIFQKRLEGLLDTTTIEDMYNNLLQN